MLDEVKTKEPYWDNLNKEDRKNKISHIPYISSTDYVQISKFVEDSVKETEQFANETCDFWRFATMYLFRMLLGYEYHNIEQHNKDASYAIEHPEIKDTIIKYASMECEDLVNMLKECKVEHPESSDNEFDKWYSVSVSQIMVIYTPKTVYGPIQKCLLDMLK